MQNKVYSFLILFQFVVCSCSDNKDIVYYHKFNNQTWSRFDLLRLEVPVKASEKYYDIFLFIHHTKEFEFDNLDFNMKMNTPSGEERSKKYHIDIRRKDGGFIGQISNDSCEVSVTLKEGIKLTKGILTIELENLVPRLQTKGLLGFGIKLHPVR